MKNIYHGKLKFYKGKSKNDYSLAENEEDCFLQAEIIKCENNFCEGIIYDEINGNRPIIGIFDQYHSLELYEIFNNGKINKYVAKKESLSYDGKYYSIDEGEELLDNFHIFNESLQRDPRDDLRRKSCN